MLFEEAVLTVVNAVRSAPLNMTVAAFHRDVPSLVVRWREEYDVMTVEQWRKSNRPEIVLTIAARDSFDG